MESSSLLKHTVSSVLNASSQTSVRKHDPQLLSVEICMSLDMRAVCGVIKYYFNLK